MSGNLVVHFYPASLNSPLAGAGLPLARYLPPLPSGMVSAWLKENASPGAWLLDPLGATPALALEAARAGCRVIVACNNPIVSFMIEVLAQARSSGEFQAALAELALARRGDERLDRHIQSLYHTRCSRCDEIISAQAYLWRKGEEHPFARLARCPKCGEEGEHPVTPYDIERLKLLGNDALHRSRAIQRVIMNEDENREDVEQALSSFLPRPLYILFTLINKLEGLQITPERVRLLQALLISAFDAGNTLWPWPGGRSRPRQLVIPTQFKENNLWDALEEAVAEWSARAGTPAVPVTHWPQLPLQEGGICLFHGRVKGLMPLPEEIGPQAVMTVFPRPNQAFWTLSAVWAGWLWGREAALPLRNILDRRRFDWNWHTSALHSALAAISHAIPAETPFFGLLTDLAPGFLAAALTAAEAAGFHLDGLALQSEESLAQAAWRSPGPATTLPTTETANRRDPGTLETVVRGAMRLSLLERGEPAPYLTVYAAGMAALAQEQAVPESLPGISGEVFTRLQTALTRPFSDRGFLKLYPGSERSTTPSESGDEERGWWWLAGQDQPSLLENGQNNLPLSDRIEMEVIRLLQKRQVCTLEDLQQGIAPLFPGLLTPSNDLLRACLDSYAEPVLSQPGIWRIRPGESPTERRSDLLEMRSALTSIGERLALQVSSTNETSITWEPTLLGPGWAFYLMASSIVSRFVLAAPTETLAYRRVLVLPGGRSRLLSYKLRRDPRLTEALQGWQILKFRHLRELAQEFAGRADLSQPDWDILITQDPLTDDATQMPLFKT